MKNPKQSVLELLRKIKKFLFLDKPDSDLSKLCSARNIVYLNFRLFVSTILELPSRVVTGMESSYDKYKYFIEKVLNSG